MNDYWLLTDVSPINLKGWHLLMPYQSNLTRWSVHPNGVPPNEKIDSPITYRCFATTGLQHPRAMDPQIHFLLHPGQNLSNPLLTVFPPTLTIPFSASMCEPHAISISLPSSFLLAWRSRNASLYRRTRREIATWEVTEIICWRRCLQMPFLAIAPPSFPPTTLIASWSMNSLPSLPRPSATPKTRAIHSQELLRIGKMGKYTSLGIISSFSKHPDLATPSHQAGMLHRHNSTPRGQRSLRRHELGGSYWVFLFASWGRCHTSILFFDFGVLRILCRILTSTYQFFLESLN